MDTRIHYLRLLNEVERRFDKPDWTNIRAWLEEEAGKERVRDEQFIPLSIQALNLSDEVALQPGDRVLGPIFSRTEQFRVPPGSQLGASLYGLGSIEVGENSQIIGDILALEQILWQGGATSSVRNLVAPRIRLSTPAGLIYGGIWCDTLYSDEKDAHVLPGTVVQGQVIVDEPADGVVVVGAESQLGGLQVQGTVETQRGVAASHIYANGPIRIGRNNRVGYVEGTDVWVESGSQIGQIVSSGDVALKRGVTVDTIRAVGNISLDANVTVTGSVLLSEQGQLRISGDKGWHTQRERWFYLLPDQELQPFVEGNAPPANSSLLALRSLTHLLWKQVQELSGRPANGSV
ncbi:MAG: hypothetical protein H0T73_06865 [Ardenticatenales bacterium]|nr:hypothetical protein [Ardenticatenales bacterium]